MTDSMESIRNVEVLQIEFGKQLNTARFRIRLPGASNDFVDDCCADCAICPSSDVYSHETQGICNGPEGATGQECIVYISAPAGETNVAQQANMTTVLNSGACAINDKDRAMEQLRPMFDHYLNLMVIP